LHKHTVKCLRIDIYIVNWWHVPMKPDGTILI